MSPARAANVSVGPAVATAASSPQLLEEVLALTRRLRLPHLRRAAAEVIPTARAQRWDPAEVLRVLLAEEIIGRDDATVRIRRKRANFPAGKTFDVWEEARCSIPTATQQALRTLEWVDRHENLCVCGPSGTGKSHLREALGQAAIDSGRTVAWFAIDELGALVRRHRADDSISKAIRRITRVADRGRPMPSAELCRHQPGGDAGCLGWGGLLAAAGRLMVGIVTGLPR